MVSIPVRILVIDLSSQSWRFEDRTELFTERLGGSGVAIRLLHEFCKPGTDPLDPGNPIILTIGSITALYPLASKCVAMFKSPLTGNLGESHAGGRTAVVMRGADIGGLVITGKAEKPTYLSITHDSVQFRDARTLWGMSRNDTAARIIRNHDGSPGTRTIIRIGRAGEELVRYAAVTTETYRHFGRMGLGCVFGSKYLKAVVISGDNSIPLDSWDEYRKIYDSLFDQVTRSSLMKKYHDIGTPVNILPLSAQKSLPIKNLTSQTLPGVEMLSGEEFAMQALVRRVACSHCPVSCIHIAQVRTPYPHDPYFFKTTSVGYDYEPIFSLGSMLGITNPTDVLTLIDETEASGMDAMSAGVAAAYATEAMMNGLITPDDTGGITLSFGDSEPYLKFLSILADQKLPFYKDLGRGVTYASKIWGGEEYALAFGGLEMPGYHTGPAAHIGYLCGARHSHLDGAGYSIDQKPTETSPKTPQEIALELFEEESFRQILSSLVVCFFARNLYTPDTIQACLKTCGITYSPEELQVLGREILKEKYKFKIREGFILDPDSVSIPNRIFELPSGKGRIDPDVIKEGVAAFHDLVTG